MFASTRLEDSLWRLPDPDNNPFGPCAPDRRDMPSVAERRRLAILSPPLPLNPFRVQPGFGAARSRRLTSDSTLRELRRPQPAEDVSVSSPSLSGLSSAAGEDEPHLYTGQRAQSAIHSVAGSDWDHDAGTNALDAAYDQSIGSAHDLGTNESALAGRVSRLSILGLEPRPEMAVVPSRQPKDLIADLGPALGVSEVELAPGKRQLLYTEQRVGRSKSKEELAGYRHAAHHLALGGSKLSWSASNSGGGVGGGGGGGGGRRRRRRRQRHTAGQPARHGRRASVGSSRAGSTGGGALPPPLRSKSAMLVRDIGSELDPPLATPPLPWLQPEGSMEAVRALRPQELHCDGSTVSLLDTVLQKNSATTKLSENVYIHKPTRRERAKRGDERQLDDSSVPLSVTQLNHQDYIINTDGVMTQTGAGYGEFMPMPEWLQESSYCHLRRGRFSCFLWGIFNKWLHAARRNKFVRTRAIIGQRWLQLRPTFGETLLDVLGRCVSEAQSPPSKTLAVRRHSRANVPELSKSLREQRIAVHESFVEMVEQCSRLLERVASEVKAGEMRRKAEAIEKAQAAEFHKWKKYAKDAAKIPGRPSSKHYGPNNRLQPKPPQIHPLHRPLEPELDTTLLPRFIRLCDFMCVHCCVSELLRHHCGYLVSQLQESSRAKTDSVRAVATFNAPALAAQARSAAETLRAMGADDARSIDAAAEEQEGRLGSALYFEPSVRVFHQCISAAMQDFVARFNEPRLIFYEGFQESLKDIVSFHEMNQVRACTLHLTASEHMLTQRMCRVRSSPSRKYCREGFWAMHCCSCPKAWSSRSYRRSSASSTRSTVLRSFTW
jgi:hypothetical protein